MHALRVPLIGFLSLALALTACGDDAVEAGGTTSTTGGGTGSAEVPDRVADLVGTITSVTPFEPVTEDCTPAEDLDPDGAVSSDDPPICTPEDNDILGTILVEEQPDDPEAGRKISYTVTTASVLAGVDGFDALAEGQAVDTWVSGGVCAESYPEQCGLEALRVTD